MVIVLAILGYAGGWFGSGDARARDDDARTGDDGTRTGDWNDHPVVATRSGRPAQGRLVATGREQLAHGRT